MNDDKVVHAFPSAQLPENLITVEPRNPALPYHCDHPALRLDEHERTVHCAACTATLDPFNFLLNNARTLQTAWQNYRSTRTMVGELQERVTVLKKEEARLRSAVKRLQAKVPAPLDVRGNPTP
jgi:hypothetical protein